MPTLDETRQLITKLFADVKDAGGHPYVDHCFRVEQGLPEDATEDERHAALLHDVLEDTDLTWKDLIKLGYSNRTVVLTKHLTHTKVPGRTYLDYIEDLAATLDKGLINIKLSDNRDNSDPARHTCFTPEDSARRMKKYAKAREILQAGLAETHALEHFHNMMDAKF